MKVVLTRPRQLMDMGRPYSIRTEERELAVINAGEEVVVDIPADAIHLYATLNWFSSNPIPVIELSNNTRLQVKNGCAAWKMLIPILPLIHLMNKSRYLKLDVE